MTCFTFVGTWGQEVTATEAGKGSYDMCTEFVKAMALTTMPWLWHYWQFVLDNHFAQKFVPRSAVRLAILLACAYYMQWYCLSHW